MFTGLIEEIGTVRRIERRRKKALGLTIAADTVLENTKIGDSIATNGVCLTVVALTDDSFSADVMAESCGVPRSAVCRAARRSIWSAPMPADGRFGGHIVSGHIDGTGSVLSQRPRGQRRVGTIKTPAPLLRYIVEKGSIAIDGVSLTVAAVTDTDFSVSIIPHTGAQTILLGKKPGEPVNLECDVIGKYVEKMLTPHKSSGITMDFLAQHGF